MFGILIYYLYLFCDVRKIVLIYFDKLLVMGKEILNKIIIR